MIHESPYVSSFFDLLFSIYLLTILFLSHPYSMANSEITFFVETKSYFYYYIYNFWH